MNNNNNIKTFFEIIKFLYFHTGEEEFALG